MQWLAWNKELTEATKPVYFDAFVSPYSNQTVSLAKLKYLSLVQTSCVPLARFPTSLTHPLSDGTLTLNVSEKPFSYTAGQPPLLRDAEDMTVKLTQNGIVFLGKRVELEIDGKKKVVYEETGKFRNRYVGSKLCNVDLNGWLWLDANELKSDIKAGNKDKPKRAKKNPSVAEGDEKTNFSVRADANIPDNPDTANVIEKKPRVKSYKIDKSKVRHRIYNYINTAKGKKRLFFWTVTFPAGTPDDSCYQAFNTWLTSLRQRRMVKDYLWIAERQEGERLKTKKEPTHTLHFHIALPHYLDVKKANAMMRGTLKNLAKQGLVPGVICHTKTKETYLLPCIAKYNGVHLSKHKKTGKPINFAIKKGAKALADYLTKYVTKNDAGQKRDDGSLIAPGFTHLAWHNSRGFSCLFTGITCTIKEFTEAGYGAYLFRGRMVRSNFSIFIPWDQGPPPAFKKHLYEVNSLVHELLDENELLKQTIKQT